MPIINALSSDTKVKVSQDDIKNGFLLDKLLAGTGIQITKQDVAGVETLTFSLVGGSQNTDWHSGFYLIESGEEITVELNKQMTNWNGLQLDGSLILDGELILEP